MLNKLLDKNWLRRSFADWSEVLEHPNKLNKMIQIIRTFLKKDQIMFYRKLSDTMFQFDCLIDDYNFNVSTIDRILRLTEIIPDLS